MTESSRSGIRKRAVWNVLVPVMLGGALLTLAFGVTRPVLSTDKLLEDARTWSILSGGFDLLRGGDALLGLLLLSFSAAFPAVKLMLLGVAWWQRSNDGFALKLIGGLRTLGKWSMLDVLTVAVFATAARLGILADAHVLPGVYVFGGAILLSLVATYVIWWLLEVRRHRRQRGLDGPMPIALLVALVATAVLLTRAITHPLMRVEKWIFWDHTYSLLSGARQLIADGNAVLGLALLLFVLVMPGLAIGCWIALWIGARTGRRMERLVTFAIVLDDWAMIDVFALALVIVINRIGSDANVTPLRGMWMLAAAAPLFLLTSLWGRREVRA